MMSPPKSNIRIILTISLSLSLCFWEGDAQVAGFRLAIQWPPAFCSKSPAVCDAAKVKQDFTIHGLWPYDSNKRSLINCPASAFNVNNVKSLRAALDNAWPTYDKGRNEDFWEREWDKHGSCSEYILSQYNYFQRAYSVWDNLLLTFVLKSAGIIPNNLYYNVQSIINAVAGRTGHNPRVVCKTNSANEVLLSEIYVCLDAQAQNIISCTGNLEAGCGGVSANIKFLS